MMGVGDGRWCWALDVAQCGLSLTPPVMCEYVRGWHQATPMFSNKSQCCGVRLERVCVWSSVRAPHFTPQHWLLCHMGLY